MKARPIIVSKEGDYLDCTPNEATHVQIYIPSGVCQYRLLPVQIGGVRANTGNWSWNGDIDKPTLKPSVLTQTIWNGEAFRCHSFVSGGEVQFLNDCSHDNKGKTMELLNV